MADDKYKAERGEPASSSCSDVSLLFDGYYLKLLSGTGVGGMVIQAWHARSGVKGSNGNFDYSLTHQKTHNHGPIPAGEYWIQPMQLKNLWAGGDAWGDSRITIHPRTATDTFSRGGFFIHGGKDFGSIGCIDLAYGMKSFRKKLEELSPDIVVDWGFDQKNSCTIPLTVKYGTEIVPAP